MKRGFLTKSYASGGMLAPGPPATEIGATSTGPATRDGSNTAQPPPGNVREDEKLKDFLYQQREQWVRPQTLTKIFANLITMIIRSRKTSVPVRGSRIRAYVLRI